MKLLARLSAVTFVAALSGVLFMPRAARATGIENGFTVSRCVEINSSIFQKDVIGIGSSCAVFDRKKVASDRALEDVKVEGAIECDAIDDTNTAFWADYCQAVCDYNGFADTNGIEMCSYTITATDTWTEYGTGCLGGREFNRKEADVQCGCKCFTYYPPSP